MSGIGPISETPGVDLWIGPVPPFQTINLVIPSVERAYFMPFTVRRAVTVTQALLYTGVASGHFDIGIYDDSAVRLTSTGSTVSTVTADVQTTNLSSALTLLPGVRYWAAVVADNNTITFERAGANTLSANYARHNTSAFPLPNPASFPGTAFGSFVRVMFQ